MSARSKDLTAQARSLCEQQRWGDVLALTGAWRAEKAAAAPWFYQGVAQAALGRWAEAETSYRRALKLDAADFKTWNNLASLLFGALNRPAEAVQCLSQALKADPQNALGWANLASLNGQLGRHAPALECAERALALNPQMVEAQLHRARAAQALGKPDILRAASEALAQMPLAQFQRAR